MNDNFLMLNVDEFLLPFKITIYLNKNCYDAHLDLAVIMYQIRSRIKRFIKKVFEKKLIFFFSFIFKY